MVALGLLELTKRLPIKYQKKEKRQWLEEICSNASVAPRFLSKKYYFKIKEPGFFKLSTVFLNKILR